MTPIALTLTLSLTLTLATARAAPPALALSAEPLNASCGAGSDILHAPATLASTPGGMALFQAGARPADWSGQLTRSSLALDAQGTPHATVQWSAEERLPKADLRSIYTSAVVRGVQTTLPFAWDELAAAQRSALNRPPPPARDAPDQRGPLRLAWLRGDRSEEGRLLRRRGSVLGDVVHGVPLYLGAPQPGAGGAGHAAFKERYQARRPAVYLGANDGMLHAFDAETGAELFAYVPNVLFPYLNLLPDPAYAHRAYVDGPAAAGDAVLAGNWRSVLVSALGGGAQGVFALDITDPAAFGAGAGALWEFTDKDDAAMGNLTTAPQIAAADAPNGRRYFAVVPGGMNSHVEDGHADSSGASALFLLALDKPADEAWRRNRNYYRLQTAAGSGDAATGLSAPALVLDDSGALRYAYAGDLQGNLWRFSFSGGAPWSGTSAIQPLFTARNDAGQRQPIAQQPRVVHAPDGAYLILFGTGKLLQEKDREQRRTQSFYAVLDAAPAQAVQRPLTRAELQARVVDGAATAAQFEIRGPAFSYTGAHARQGWYLDFPHAGQTGERSVASAAIAGGKLFFNTVLPGAGACAQPASRSYLLDILSGLASDSEGLPAPSAYTGALSGDRDFFPGPPVPIVTARGRKQGVQQRATAEKQFTAINLSATRPGAQATARVRAAMPAGRISWREIPNWRELHQRATP